MSGMLSNYGVQQELFQVRLTRHDAEPESLHQHGHEGGCAHLLSLSAGRDGSGYFTKPRLDYAPHPKASQM